MKRRILILGASGFLGSYLMRSLQPRYDVHGTYCSTAVAGLVHLDLRDTHETQSVLRNLTPDVLVHCGGLTRPDVCETEPQMAYEVNVAGIERILGAWRRMKVVYFSTDYVFDGGKGAYTEEDTASPINVYGECKLESERRVLQSDAANLVLRVAGLYGWNPLRNEFLEALGPGRQRRFAVDLISSHTLLNDLATHMPWFLERKGLFHVCGPKPLSRYEFARLAVTTLGLGGDVIPATAADVYPGARRPANSSLRSSRQSLPFTEPTVGLALVRDAASNVGGPTRIRRR